MWHQLLIPKRWFWREDDSVQRTEQRTVDSWAGLTNSFITAFLMSGVVFCVKTVFLNYKGCIGYIGQMKHSIWTFIKAWYLNLLLFHRKSQLFIFNEQGRDTHAATGRSCFSPLVHSPILFIFCLILNCLCCTFRQLVTHVCLHKCHHKHVRVALSYSVILAMMSLVTGFFQPLCTPMGSRKHHYVACHCDHDGFLRIKSL